MELSAGKYYVWYGDTKYHAIHAKKRGRIALVSGEKAMREIISSVNGFNAMKQQRDELLAALKDARQFVSDHVNVGGKYPYINGTELVRDAYKELKQIDAAIAKCES